MNTFCFDVETSGLDRKEDKLILIGAKYNKEDIYVDYPPYTKSAAYLKDSAVVKIGHNILFDVAFVEKYGLEVNGPLYDTRVMAFAKWPYDKLKLKQLGSKVFNVPVLELKSIKGRGKVEDIAKPILEGYVKQDVQLTYDLFNLTYPVRGHWIDVVEFKLTEILHEIEKRGVFLETDKLRLLHGAWERQVKEISGKYTINLNSPKQLKEYLIQKGFTGQSTDKVSLISSKERIPECKEILKYRELSTLVGRYTGSFLKTQREGYIYGEFNQAGQEKNDFAVKTGRLSSSNPNLQNIPSRTSNGKALRKCFIAPSGYKLVVADASQIEPRFVAYFTKDETLTKIFTSGIDFHGVVTQAAYQKTDFTTDERFVGKTLGLATMYLASPYRLMMELRKYEIFLSLKEVEKRQNNIIKKFASVIEWGKRYAKLAESKGYFVTYGGRRYPFNNEVAVFNNLVQSSQADYLKLCVLAIEERGHKIINTVHDEVLVYTKEPERTINDINYIMSSVISLGDIPVKADVREVTSWGDK